MMRQFSFMLYFLGIGLLSLTGLSCGGATLDPCVDTDCPSGEACVVENGEAVCQATGGDGDGGNPEGDSCETDEDCATGLVCEDVGNGVLQCTPG